MRYRVEYSYKKPVVINSKNYVEAVSREEAYKKFYQDTKDINPIVSKMVEDDDFKTISGFPKYKINSNREVKSFMQNPSGRIMSGVFVNNMNDRRLIFSMGEGRTQAVYTKDLMKLAGFSNDNEITQET